MALVILVLILIVMIISCGNTWGHKLAPISPQEGSVSPSTEILGMPPILDHFSAWKVSKPILLMLQGTPLDRIPFSFNMCLPPITLVWISSLFFLSNEGADLYRFFLIFKAARLPGINFYSKSNCSKMRQPFSRSVLPYCSSIGQHSNFKLLIC